MFQQRKVMTFSYSDTWNYVTIVLMEGFGQVIEQIDQLEAERQTAEHRRQELCGEVGYLVNAVASSEVTYELTSRGPISQPVDMGALAEAIKANRESLDQAIENNVAETKKVLHREHEINVLREELVFDVTSKTT